MSEGETKLCRHCGKEIEENDTPIRAFKWRHMDGYFNCDGRRGHAETYAEPLEEVPSGK